MEQADLILYRANVITLDPTLPQAEMVALKGDRICGVGKNEEAKQFQGVGTKLLDCEGKTLLPGFIDAHCHILAYARSLLSLDLSSATFIAQIKESLRQEAQRTPPETWLYARGYNEFYLKERRHPNRRDLDEASSQHPIRLVHRSGHAQVLNSLALAQVGITIETPEPPGGLIDRDESGEPNGLLVNMDEYIGQRLPPLAPGELERGLALANASFLGYGLTTLHDATASNDLRQWQLFKSFKEKGQLQSRLILMAGSSAMDEFKAQGLSTGSRDNQFRLGPVKFVLSQAPGQLHPAQRELNQLALKAHKAGFQLAFHAVEAAEIAAAITALKYAKVQPRHRPRIEHASVCPPELLSGLQQRGALVVSQPAFIYYSGERYLATVSPTEFPWLYRLGSFYRAGLHPAGSSDAPVASPNPFIGLYAVLSRKAERGEVLLPHEALSPPEALHLYTLNGAYAAFEEQDKGSIQVGKLADLVLLSDDPTTLPPEAIKELSVELTILGGHIAFAAP